jgi:hypothetical protein
MSPSEAEDDAWFAWRGLALKEHREVDEASFRAGWRQGCGFTFRSTSRLSPSLDAFVRWMEYVTDWTPAA